ncbi:MAG: hypothetical protein K2N31_06950 [Treponemataceae bacterium]|nr:hypothetical protein [Treponemataceae bacterium]MDE7228041.1 hypothetical protein [Treponemataceae bacterium]
MSVFGIVMTALMCACGVAVVVYIVGIFLRRDHKSIAETIRGNDEKYE